VHGPTAARLARFGVALTRLIVTGLALGQLDSTIFGAQALDGFGGSDDASRVDLVVSEKLGKLASHVSSLRSLLQVNRRDDQRWPTIATLNRASIRSRPTLSWLAHQRRPLQNAS